MPALANPTQKRKRASIARMLAHMTIGLGITTIASMVSGQAQAQTCDRCAGLSSPSCGCESPSATANGSKRSTCKCVPRQSLGEKLLGHFEKIGDRIEANARSTSASGKCRCEQFPKTHSHGAPTCGCESSEPSCGCETNSVSAAGVAYQLQFAPSRVPIVRPDSRNFIPFSNLSQDDGTYSAPPVPRSMKTQRPTAMETAPPPFSPKFSTPSLTVPEPKVQRVPRVEPDLSKQSAPNTLKPTPFDPPPEYVPKANPPKPKSVPNLEPNMPDVLVDPFKDDVSFRGTREKMEGILLTSDRRTSNKAQKNNTLNLTPSNQQAETEDTTMPAFDRPASLTPSQRQIPATSNSPSLQFEASSPSAGENSKVVSSSYMEVLPVKIVRRVTANSEISDVPQVPKMKVPSRR